MHDPATYEEKRFDSSLFTVVKKVGSRVTPDGDVAVIDRELHGLCFGAHMELVMILLAHAYRGLRDQTTIGQYARAMAAAMQAFAEPIAVGDCASFPDPNFLLHGINRTTLAEVVERFVCNGRIIHETIARKDTFIGKYGNRVYLEPGLKRLVEEGLLRTVSGCVAISPGLTKSTPMARTKATSPR